MLFRKIEPRDKAAIAEVIRSVMTSYNCVGEGFSIEDAEVDDMYTAYDNERSVYYVIEDNAQVVGGAGIAPLEGGAEDTCELKKMYYYPIARGKGLGSQMMDLLLKEAKTRGYKKCYLETVERMQKANKLKL